MRKLFAFPYEGEFIDDLTYLNERYGEEFESYGDSLHDKVEFETWGEDC